MHTISHDCMRNCQKSVLSEIIEIEFNIITESELYLPKAYSRDNYRFRLVFYLSHFLSTKLKWRKNSIYKTIHIKLFYDFL